MSPARHLSFEAETDRHRIQRFYRSPVGTGHLRADDLTSRTSFDAMDAIHENLQDRRRRLVRTPRRQELESVRLSSVWVRGRRDSSESLLQRGTSSRSLVESRAYRTLCSLPGYYLRSHARPFVRARLENLHHAVGGRAGRRHPFSECVFSQELVFRSLLMPVVVVLSASPIPGWDGTPAWEETSVRETWRRR